MSGIEQDLCADGEKGEEEAESFGANGDIYYSIVGSTKGVAWSCFGRFA